jgi:hypothetical protein
MDERSGSIRLVESRPDEARGLVATVPRGEVEKALRSDAGPVDLLLDVERVAADAEGRETQRIALAWESDDLERLLTTTSGDQVSLTFDEEEIRRLLDEDVEAHGMREKLAVVSVIVGMAAAGAGSAAAAVAPDGGSSSGTPVAAAASHGIASEVSTGLTGVTADRVAPSEISTGLGDPQAAPVQAPSAPSEISTGIVQAPAVTPAEVTTGITQHPTAAPVSASPTSDDWAPGPEGVALVAGMILAVSAAGFAVRAQRRRPATS